MDSYNINEENARRSILGLYLKILHYIALELNNLTVYSKFILYPWRDYMPITVTLNKGTFNY